MNPKNLKIFPVIAALAIAAQLLVACASATKQPSPATQAPAPTRQPVASSPEAVSKIDPLDFQQAVRKLWEDHITWTRVYIISVLAELPESESAAQRLLQNQIDIGDAIKPFYGEQVGDQLASLLKDHILTAADLLTAAMAGDNAKLEATNQRWYDNANQIAAFLNSANPDHWPVDEMQHMMKSHLDLTLEEATARLKQDWAGDVAAYDKVHAEILEMADMLAAGIIMQFPDKFSTQHATQKEIDITLGMDKLWEDHITWTRIFIISTTSSLPDANAAAKRLLENQADIGNAIKSFFGDQAGEQLTSLLKEHILTAADLLVAAKSGDSAKFEEANQRWYENAHQIAAFLNSANPESWPLDDMEHMMKSHLDLTLEEAGARLQGDWAGDIQAYDKVHLEILEMAGILTKGLIAQSIDQNN